MTRQQIQQIIDLRLYNQQLLTPSLSTPEDLVGWMGAVQSQDYAGAKWAVACRIQHPIESEIDKAFDAGSILRTHVLRPTWHFVLPADIRWMVELTEPRISAFSAKQFNDLDLTKKLLLRTNKIIVKALESSDSLTRKELGAILAKARIDTTELRLTYIVFRAELDRLICSGPKRGKQMTYALLDARAPNSKTFKKDEALFELARRYFTSRGPATLRDFIWWSGLSPADARDALETIKSHVLTEEIGGENFYFVSSTNEKHGKSRSSVHLLPSWDEYNVAYKDRSLVIEPRFESVSGHGIFFPVIVTDGKVGGAWRRKFKNNSVVLEMQHFEPPTQKVVRNCQTTARLYARYLMKDLVLKQNIE